MDAGAWNDAEGLSQRALQLMQQRRWNDALEELELALSLDPYNAANLYHRGVVLDELGRPRDAIEDYERADQIHPDHPDVLNRWALDMHQLGDTREALKLFASIERRAPAYEPAYCNHVHLLVELNRHEEAEEVFYLARLHNEHCPRCYYTMGLSMAAQGKHEHAVRCLRRAMDLPGASAEVNRRLAESLVALGDADAARLHLRQSLSVDSNQPSALAMMVELLIDVDAQADAEKWLSRLQRVLPDGAPTHLLVARLAMVQQRFEAAERSLERAVQIDPTISRAHLMLAELYGRQGKHDLARQQLHAELLLGPHSTAKLAVLARRLLALGDRTAAAGCYRKVLEREPTRAAAWVNLGICECEIGNLETGIHALRQAITVNPKLVPAYYNLALALAERGSWPAAMTIVSQGLEQRPRVAELVQLRRRLWLRRVRRWIIAPFRR
jgi:tetratricopeptide (TPR) repeat protein